MKTVALVASVALHLGALSAIPTNGEQESTAKADAVKTTRTSEESCKCDLEMTADCANVIESR